MPLAFAVESLDDVVRITFHGDLDMSRAHDVGMALQHAAEADTRPILVALDASVRYIDSFTLSEFLLFRRRLPNRRTALYVADPNVFRILSITDTISRLNATTNEARAIELLLEPRPAARLKRLQ